MEILRSGFHSVLGGSATSSHDSPTPADTIERLVDRLVSSTLLVSHHFEMKTEPFEQVFRIIRRHVVRHNAQKIGSTLFLCVVSHYTISPNICRIVLTPHLKFASDRRVSVKMNNAQTQCSLNLARLAYVDGNSALNNLGQIK
jgi:sulfatase maturation enzyme AslB (radical SAM superfamily)